jgi:hypothetical protein
MHRSSSSLASRWALSCVSASDSDSAPHLHTILSSLFRSRADGLCMNTSRAAALIVLLAATAPSLAQAPAYTVRVAASVPALSATPNEEEWQPVGIKPDGSLVMRVIHADENMPGRLRFSSLVETPQGFQLLQDRSGGTSLETIAKAVDSSGRIHGFLAEPNAPSADKVVLWDAPGPARRQTDVFNTSVPVLIDAAASDGYMVGNAYDELNPFNPPTLIRNNEVLSWDATGAGIDGWSRAINSRGEVVGSTFSIQATEPTFLWSQIASREIDFPEHFDDYFGMGIGISGINDNGWIVGNVTFHNAQGSVAGTLLWRDGQREYIAPLVPLTDSFREATIDNLGTVLSADNMGTFLYRDGNIFRTSDLDLTGFTGHLIAVDRLELDGRVIGQALVEGVRVPVVLTPIPGPAPLALLLAGCFAVQLRRRRSQTSLHQR